MNRGVGPTLNGANKKQSDIRGGPEPLNTPQGRCPYGQKRLQAEWQFFHLFTKVLQSQVQSAFHEEIKPYFAKVGLVPTQSQREEIQELHEALARVPKPVVVLLDEIDRMQKDELLVLLKGICLPP